MSTGLNFLLSVTVCLVIGKSVGLVLGVAKDIGLVNETVFIIGLY